MQSQARKNCLYWYKFIDYTVAIELLLRVSTSLNGLIRPKKTIKVSKKSSKHSKEKNFFTSA